MSAQAALTPPLLLGGDDPPPFECLIGGARFPAVLCCDHASRAVPRTLDNLGLGAAQSARHIAWDIGAAELGRRLARRLGLPLVLAGYSRLVIDCNRALDDPTSILAVSDGDVVPGNLDLSPQQRAARASEIFAPYHAAIERQLAQAAERVQAPALIALHSFTERMHGTMRPWHCGVLWDRDPRLAQPLLDALRREPGLVVGDNEPYSGRHPADYTIDTHAERRGWPHVCLEIRQDQLGGAEGIEAWAERLERILAPLLADASLYRPLPRS